MEVVENCVVILPFGGVEGVDVNGLPPSGNRQAGTDQWEDELEDR